MVINLDAIRKSLTSAHILHMEREIEFLRGQVAMLHLQLMEALKPAVPAPAIKREFPKFPPAQTSWEAYLAEQIRLQEVEEEPADGTHSSGRV